MKAYYCEKCDTWEKATKEEIENETIKPWTPKRCAECDQRFDYEERYDSYYCKKCDVWNEFKCSDPECEFCVNKPLRPSDMHLPKK
jgi:hypothetical protein